VHVYRSPGIGQTRAVTVSRRRRRPEMGNMDEAKGRAKQAVGDLTDDDDLRREGKVDEKSGQAKDKLDDMKDKAEDVIDKVKDKLT
jgi:uncharacterized protein YjbJ (UPF0337 family)